MTSWRGVEPNNFIMNPLVNEINEAVSYFMTRLFLPKGASVWVNIIFYWNARKNIHLLEWWKRNSKMKNEQNYK